MARFVQRNPRPRKSVLLIILNILIGIMLAVVVLCGIAFRINSRESYRYRKFDEQSSFYSIQRGRYADLVEDYYYYQGILGEIREGSEEAAALADYADAAFRYSAYEAALSGEQTALSEEGALRDRMQKQMKRMLTDRERAGIYAPEADRIDRMLQGTFQADE